MLASGVESMSLSRISSIAIGLGRCLKERQRLRKIISEIRYAVSEEGKSMSAAMAEHPMAFPELFGALQQGTVDGQENPIPVILAAKFSQVQKHLSLTGHVYSPALLLLSPKVWNKLSDADKKVFVDTFRAAAERSNAEIVKSEEALATDFSTVYKKTVVKSDRAAFQKVFVPFHTGPDATWDKALYDKVQAIK